MANVAPLIALILQARNKGKLTMNIYTHQNAQIQNNANNTLLSPNQKSKEDSDKSSNLIP